MATEFFALVCLLSLPFFTVALRVLIVWLFNNTGRSVLAATLCHASSNLSWAMFLNAGSHWDPGVSGALLAAAAAGVVAFRGPRTLTRSRRAA